MAFIVRNVVISSSIGIKVNFLCKHLHDNINTHKLSDELDEKHRKKLEDVGDAKQRVGRFLFG
jgi:hypothetical protein